MIELCRPHSFQLHSLQTHQRTQVNNFVFNFIENIPFIPPSIHSHAINSHKTVCFDILLTGTFVAVHLDKHQNHSSLNNIRIGIMQREMREKRVKNLLKIRKSLNCFCSSVGCRALVCMRECFFVCSFSSSSTIQQHYQV